MSKNEYIDSPMRYTGSKFKLLNQLLPLFPDGIDTFYDAFCGGLSVTLNVHAIRYVANDADNRLISLYQYMKDSADFVSEVDSVLDLYGLKDKGVNEQGYYDMRNEYLATENPVYFFATITQAFNSILQDTKDGRLRSCYGFGGNNFTGRRKVNTQVVCDKLKTMDVTFCTGSYADLNPTSSDFVYCDPPYLITMAAYNAYKWNRVSEYELLRWLDTLDSNGIRFGVSNVLRHKGKFNAILYNWAKKYNVIPIQKKYGHLAHARKRTEHTDEVFICNY